MPTILLRCRETFFAYPKASISVAVLGALLLIAFPVGVALGLPWAQDKEGRPASPPLDDRKAVVQTVDHIPPPPPAEMGLVDNKGYVRVGVWDDRHLTPEQKKANPAVNPRWAPLARCLEAAGVSAGADPAGFRQDDLDSLIARLNAGGPLVTNEAGRLTVRHSPETDAYTRCAVSTLQVFSEDLYKILTPSELQAAQAAGDAPQNSPPAQAR